VRSRSGLRTRQVLNEEVSRYSTSNSSWFQSAAELNILKRWKTLPSILRITSIQSFSYYMGPTGARPSSNTVTKNCDARLDDLPDVPQ
jgi:hypothetical protein